MKKIFLIGWKDLTLAFRDRAALILMLAAPFILTLGLGAVTGRFSGSSSGSISHIPVAIVNQDDGQLGSELVTLFQSKELGDLVNPTVIKDAAEARRLVDDDKTASAIIIPAGFTKSIIPSQGGTTNSVVQIELYTNPNAPNSSSILKTILEQYLSQVEVGRVGAQVSVSQLIKNRLIQPQDAGKTGAEIGSSQAGQATSAVTLKNVTSQGKTVEFDTLALLAPGMALMFLMFTVSNGGRTLMVERAQGTLPRLLISPTSSAQVLGGKVFGIYLTGVAQMIILIGGSTLLFNLKWGDALSVLVLVLAAVAGAVGWGLIITALAKNPGQIGAIGSAIMLLFGILGGSFISLENFPAWFQTASKITPNSWGLDGFTTLAMGGTLADIWQPVVALLVMGAVLFTTAVILINRRGMARV